MNHFIHSPFFLTMITVIISGLLLEMFIWGYKKIHKDHEAFWKRHLGTPLTKIVFSTTYMACWVWGFMKAWADGKAKLGHNYYVELIKSIKPCFSHILANKSTMSKEMEDAFNKAVAEDVIH